ncbi:Glycosyltransferase AglJ [uncultured archaeon]|nr:Glycosyltransferase AglJ [uncultured archaeon]
MPLVSLVIPTLNEAKTIGECIQQANEVFKKMGLEGEIIVVDSSSDDTPVIARSHGATVVVPEKLGYGNAYLYGFKYARGKYIVLMDGDLTYDPREIDKLISSLQNGGVDMVLGTRLKGEIKQGAMPALHRYIGNPFLTWVLNKLFATEVSDAHCGMRAITRDALDRLNLKAGGMEFASEMVIEAANKNLRIAEVPITYYPRKGKSKLSPFSDGWRHLRFMMLYRPVPFLMVPGVVALIIGLALAATVSLHEQNRMHSLILGSLLLVIGYQMLLAGLYFAAYGVAYGVSSGSNLIKKIMSYHSLEKELLIGILLLAFGLTLGVHVLLGWKAAGFGELYQTQNAMMALILSILGIQTIFSGMFLSLLLLNNGTKAD